jgi:23S rRNA (cytosine1962-C5)-methyltransferase
VEILGEAIQKRVILLEMRRVILKKGGDRRISRGHLWIFRSEIKAVRGEPKAGDVVEVLKFNGEFIGLGFFNPGSLISVRLLTDRMEDIDFDFFKRRILKAYNFRKMIYPDSEVFRLVHGESDFLPGLIIDKYDNYFSVQTFSTGMDLRLSLICDVLDDLFNPAGIVERNESHLRELEGLESRKGVLRGRVEPIIIQDEGLKFKVDLLSGQKTGFFLDQRENRRLIRKFSHGRRVLDCFTNEGGFALNASIGGAEDVIGLDISESAILRARENAKLNEIKNVKFEVGDVFDKLRKFLSSRDKFDLIILDPPSFTKSRGKIKSALAGYREINSTAMKILAPGGILATSSCSHYITEEMFMDVILESSKLARRQIRQIEWRGAAPDHPVLPAMPETRYLKFGIFQLI